MRERCYSALEMVKNRNVSPARCNFHSRTEVAGSFVWHGARRKAVGWIVALAIAATGPVLMGAERSPLLTLDMSNGRAWNGLKTESQKLVYVIGVLDEIKVTAWERAAAKASPTDTFVEIDKTAIDWAIGSTALDYVKVLDTLYLESDNLPIPVVLAIKRYCTPKLKGASTRNEMDAIASELRTAVLKATQSPETEPTAAPKP